jgi:hypothetical protein
MERHAATHHHRFNGLHSFRTVSAQSMKVLHGARSVVLINRLLKNSAIATLVPKLAGFSGFLVELRKSDCGWHRSSRRETLIKIVFQQPVSCAKTAF